MAYLPNPNIQLDRLSGQVTDTSQIRVAEGNPRFQARYTFDTADYVWENVQNINSSINYQYNSNGVNLQAGTLATASVIRQTKQKFTYIPGRSIRSTFAVLFGAPKNNNVRRAGLFDDFNGYYFEMAGTGINVVRRSSATGVLVTETIAQSSWNVDKMDGTGKSGLTLDLTKIQMFCIDFSWYGAGTCALGVKIGREIYWVHLFEGGNRLDIPHIGNPNLPFRYENTNLGTTVSASDLSMWGLEVTYDGSADFNGYPRSARTPNVVRVNTTVTRPILSLRPRAIHKTKPNTGWVILDDISVQTQDGVLAYDIIYNGTLTGAVWAATDTDSICEVDSTATAITGGIRIQSGWLINASAVSRNPGPSLFPLSVTSTGVSDIISIVVANVATGGVNTDCAASFNWREVH
jgi:hypothetical protein